MFLSWLIPVEWFPEETGGTGAGAETGSEGLPEDSGAGLSAEEVGNGEAPQLTEEDLKLLQAAKVDPDSIKGLSQAATEQVLQALRKGAEFRDKVYEVEKADKEKERQRRRRELELANANLIDEEGKLNTKHLQTLTGQAAQAAGYEGLLEALARHGHLSGKVAQLITAQPPEVAAAALEFITPEAGADLEARIKEVLKGKGGTNQDDRNPQGSRNGPEDETKQLAAEASQNLAELFGERRKPGE